MCIVLYPVCTLYVIDLLHCDSTFVYVCMVVAILSGRLLQQDLHIQVYVLVYASLVGVVACVGRERYSNKTCIVFCKIVQAHRPVFLPLKMAATVRIRTNTNVMSQVSSRAR